MSVFSVHRLTLSTCLASCALARIAAETVSIASLGLGLVPRGGLSKLEAVLLRQSFVNRARWNGEWGKEVLLQRVHTHWRRDSQWQLHMYYQRPRQDTLKKNCWYWCHHHLCIAATATTVVYSGLLFFFFNFDFCRQCGHFFSHQRGTIVFLFTALHVQRVWFRFCHLPHERRSRGRWKNCYTVELWVCMKLQKRHSSGRLFAWTIMDL